MRTSVFGVLVLAFLAGACKKQEPTETSAPSAAPPAAPAPVASIQPEVHTAEPTEVKPEEPAAEEAAQPTAQPSSTAVRPASTAKAKLTATTPSASASASAKAASASSDYVAMQRCCSALEAAAQKASNNVAKSKYSSASGICKGLATQVKSGAANPVSAKTTLRAQLQGVPIPGGC